MLAVALTLTGCNTTELAFSQSDTKIATLFWNSDTAQVIEIGSTDHPYKGAPSIAIRVDGNVVFDSTTITPKSIASLTSGGKPRDVSNKSGFGHHPSPRGTRSDHRWKEGTLCIDLLAPIKRNATMPYDDSRRQGVSIIAKDDTVCAIRIVDLRFDPSNNAIQIKIGDAPWVNSRLSEEECATLFGTPEKKQNYFTE
jgi:hypothetical protein